MRISITNFKFWARKFIKYNLGQSFDVTGLHQLHQYISRNLVSNDKNPMVPLKTQDKALPTQQPPHSHQQSYKTRSIRCSCNSCRDSFWINTLAEPLLLFEAGGNEAMVFLGGASPHRERGRTRVSQNIRQKHHNIIDLSKKKLTYPSFLHRWSPPPPSFTILWCVAIPDAASRAHAGPRASSDAEEACDRSRARGRRALSLRKELLP